MRCFCSMEFWQEEGRWHVCKSACKKRSHTAEFSPAAVDSVQGVRVQGVWGGEGWRSGKDGYLKESSQGLTARRRGSNY